MKISEPRGVRPAHSFLLQPIHTNSSPRCATVIMTDSWLKPLFTYLLSVENLGLVCKALCPGNWPNLISNLFSRLPYEPYSLPNLNPGREKRSTEWILWALPWGPARHPTLLNALAFSPIQTTLINQISPFSFISGKRKMKNKIRKV